MGLPNEVRPGRGEFHENPAACICENSEVRALRDANLRKYGMGKDPARKEGEETDDHDQYHDPDDYIDWAEPDSDGEMLLQERQPANETMLDYDGMSTEEPELEDMLSD